MKMDLDVLSQEQCHCGTNKILWYIPMVCSVVEALNFSTRNGGLEVRSSTGVFVYT